MPELAQPICVKHILVSLDSSSHSFAALQAAIRLAYHYNATLKGLFVEDITLLNLSKLPFRQEVGEYSAIVREISIDGMTHSIQAQSKSVIRTFQKMVRQRDLQSNFVTLRGKVIQMILNQAQDCDLLVVGKTGTNPLARHRLGSTTRALINQYKKSVLLVEEGNRLGENLIIYFDNSLAARICLETGKDLQRSFGNLVILINDEDHQRFLETKIQLDQWSLDNQTPLTYQTYKQRTIEYPLQKINQLKSGLCILPNLMNFEDKQRIEVLLDKLNLPILFVATSD